MGNGLRLPSPAVRLGLVLREVQRPEEGIVDEVVGGLAHRDARARDEQSERDCLCSEHDVH